MCYSAIVQQDLLTLARRYQAVIDWAAMETVLSQRAHGEKIDISRGFDQYMLQLNEAAARKCQELIQQYRTRVESEWQQELFKQRKRLADRERELGLKETKTARRGRDIAQRKVDQLSGKLKRLRNLDIGENDRRIFPRWYAPILIEEEGRRLIRLMRYQCRLEGKPSFYDTKFPGTYNARRDHLREFWSPLFAHRHGIMMVDSFFENVPRHLYEKRALAAGEKEQNVVLHFNPNTGTPMIVACVWSHWVGPGEPNLDSFAAITDDPPVEILATGHTRCIISIKEENISDWLAPAQVSTQRLDTILNDKVMPLYEHVVEEREAA